MIIALCVAVRFFGITKASIWHDEGFTAMLSQRSWLEIWQGSARDVHPPLYYEMLHAWRLIFGDSTLALRSFSAVCGVIVVALGYLVAFKISKQRSVAALAGIILALNPFLVRYSQEARMYGVLGVFLLIALIGLIMVVDNHKNWLGYVLYTLSLAAGLYTHYFTALVIVSFWLYVGILYFRKKRNRIGLLFDWRWWLANAMVLVLFAPWVGNMIKQLTRGQGLGWLPKSSLYTFNDTIWQFFSFTDGRRLLQPIYWLVPLVILVIIIYLVLKDKTKERYTTLLVSFTLLPVLLAIAASLVRPVYHERYFVFSAIGVCILLALFIGRLYINHKFTAFAVAVIVVAIQLVGLRNVNAQASHKMAEVVARINSGFMNGDSIVSGELYTYFDGSYYNSTGSTMLLYTGNGRPNGYGESGLIFDKDIYLDSYNSLAAKRVWVLGKTGQHNYFDNVPTNWKLLESYSAGYSAVRLYQIQ